MGQTKKTRLQGQNVGLYFRLTISFHAHSVGKLSVPLLCSGSFPEQRAQSRGKAILVQVGLEDRLYALPAQLSGGSSKE